MPWQIESCLCFPLPVIFGLANSAFKEEHGIVRQCWTFNKDRRVTVGILSTVILGAVAGGIGKLIMPGKDPGGFVITILLGIVGSVLMGFLGSATGMWNADGGLVGLIPSVVGVIILLLIYRQVQKARGGTRL
jgi:uncharacterized membrane protein YeaQ/YmgE (transglycosylase-associated protein family)